MSGMTSATTPEEINRILVKFLPECASDYAKYPMNLGPKWLTIRDKGFKGEALYMKSENVGVKMDYVYGVGPAGPGYYSLLTNTAYINLYSRITHECPVGCCACSSASRKEYDEWDDVKRIIYARQVAKIPTDQAAASAAIDEAKGTANAWHQGLQNEQLAFNVANVAMAL